VAQRVGRSIALLFHDRGTRRGWVVSSTALTHFTPGKDPVPILQEAGWAPGPVWTGGQSRPHRYSISDRPAHSPFTISAGLPSPQCHYYSQAKLQDALAGYIYIHTYISYISSIHDIPQGAFGYET